MKFLMISCTLILLLSCSKDPDPIYDDSVPTCIQEEIESFKSNSDPCTQKGPSVIEYRFQNETVYAFDMGQCISDGSSKVMNASCETICTLGTIVGITECRGEEFSNAVQVRILWEG